jgi:dGTPase
MQLASAKSVRPIWSGSPETEFQRATVGNLTSCDGLPLERTACNNVPTLTTSGMESMTTPLYDRFVISDRLRPTTIAGRSLDDEMLSDKARIVTSTAFRRLQTKAQVFSLEKNAAVRSRLTHTMEVAIYGELIARKAAQLLVNVKLLSEANVFAFVTIVQNACLLHDVGNPPFGHLGEYAMCAWFRKHEQSIRNRWGNHGIGNPVIERHIAGLVSFDGNPQGLRTVCRLQRWKDELGLNLTVPLLASLLKYLDVNPSSTSFGKKAGFFETERELVLRIWRTLDLPLEAERPKSRFPLTFLMEAADDIAYCVSDVEDAIEKKLVSEKSFLDELPDELREGEDSFLGFKTRFTRSLVELAASTFANRAIEIAEGKYFSALLADNEATNAKVTFLKRFTRIHVYRSREAVEVELGGHRIICDLLDFFEPLLVAGTKEFQRLDPDSKNPPSAVELALEQRLYALLPNKALHHYKFAIEKEPDLEPIHRARLIVDYIAGMTDIHAVKMFRTLRGISAGGVDA